MAMGFGVDTDSGVMVRNDCFDDRRRRQDRVTLRRRPPSSPVQGVLSRGPGSMAVVTGDEAPVLGDAKGGRDHPTLDDSAGARAIRVRVCFASGPRLSTTLGYPRGAVARSPQRP